MADNFTRHECKSNIEPTPKTVIVEAYGLRKCTRLVEQVSEYREYNIIWNAHLCDSLTYSLCFPQVADDDIDVRKNALAVLCDEFRNPYVIHGCTDAGIIKVLSSMIVDPDHITRVRASRALSLAAEDAVGLEAILLDEAITEILQGMNDDSDDVRRNVYDCLNHCTRTQKGVEACVKAGVTVEFVSAVMAEENSLKPIILKTIHNTCKIDSGLQDALKTQAVCTLIDLLRGAKETDVIIQAARALGFICFSDVAKGEAIQEKGIEVLVSQMKITDLERVKKELTFALMVVTSTDEGKQQITECDGISTIIKLLSSKLASDRLVKLNVLKVISNVAINPQARRDLSRSTFADEQKDSEEKKENEDDSSSAVMVRKTPHVSCVPLIIALQEEAEQAGDTLTAKHAKIALAAVQWVP